MSDSHRLSAVMADRVEPPDSVDDFPTMPWATRALLVHCLGDEPLAEQTVWEPTCNRGYMARPLGEYFRRVFRTDIYDYSGAPEFHWPGRGAQESVMDFLFPCMMPVIEAQGVDWIICNPPFRLAEQFLARALEIAPRRGVAMLVRLQWLEGIERYRTIYREPGSLVVHPFVERVPLLRGRIDPEGGTKTAYAWFVWRQPFRQARLARGFPTLHIPPCRKQLERADDYAPGASCFHMKP